MPRLFRTHTPRRSWTVLVGLALAAGSLLAFSDGRAKADPTPPGTGSTRPPPLPDLKVEVSVPESVHAGTTFTYTVKVTNIGAGAAYFCAEQGLTCTALISWIGTTFTLMPMRADAPCGPPPAQFLAVPNGPIAIYSCYLPSLSPGQSVTSSITVKAPSATGSYKLNACANCFGVAPEGNLSNNTFWQWITVYQLVAQP